MTSVVCWINRESRSGESVWAVSDSRLTRPNSSPNSYTVLTDNCPKLFSIPLCVKSPDRPFDIDGSKLFSFGVGFAGNLTIATNVIEMLRRTLGRLTNFNPNLEPGDYKTAAPSLSEIALLTKFFAEKYIASLGVSAVSHAQVGCEFIIFGFCLKENRNKIIKLTNCDNPIVVDIDSGNCELVILGDRKGEIEESIVEIKTAYDESHLKWHRAPYYALYKRIRGEVSQTIGGYLQLCRSSCGITLVDDFMSLDDGNFTISNAGISVSEYSETIGGFSLRPYSCMSLPED